MRAYIMGALFVLGALLCTLSVQQAAAAPGDEVVNLPLKVRLLNCNGVPLANRVVEATRLPWPDYATAECTLNLHTDAAGFCIVWCSQTQHLCDKWHLRVHPGMEPNYLEFEYIRIDLQTQDYCGMPINPIDEWAELAIGAPPDDWTVCHASYNPDCDCYEYNIEPRMTSR